jgi:triacylglycerol lipase
MNVLKFAGLRRQDRNRSATRSPIAAARPKAPAPYREPMNNVSDGPHPPLWRELFAGMDWLALMRSPVYRGEGVPHGNGEPVVVVPGFMASDCYLTELRLWLERIGYHAIPSGISRNADCPAVLRDQLLETVAEVNAREGAKPALVGHSLGGLLATMVAHAAPEQVGGVIALGSPLDSRYGAHPFVMDLAERVRRGELRAFGMGLNASDGCMVDCGCPLEPRCRPRGRDGVPLFSVFSRSDGIVDWRGCLQPDPGANDEVEGTHCGLVVNPGVYQAIGHRLASLSEVPAAA